MNWSKLFFGVGGIICLLLRVFLIFTNIDPTTGFYVHGGFVLSFYSTLLILSLLIIVGYGLFVMKPSAFRVNQPALLSFASAFCGTMILLNSGLGFIDFLSEIFRWSDPMGYVTDNVLLVVLQLLRLLIGLSAGASLISYAITGGNMLRRSGFLLTPAVWTMIYTVERFMAYPQIADMSDRVLWLLTLLFFTLTMIGQARIIRGVKAEKGVKYVCAYGFACAFSGLILGISQLVTMQNVSTLSTMEWVLTTSMGLHALMMALSCHTGEEK
ncbi:MAG: hypothetical protein IJP15_08110 [Oscillospiraceae bacterium]|nr:hypothetical protein [Oscillospiraceae bacterium]